MVKVSTIIPAYNAERTIAQAIDSALSQDFKAHEVVVVNDGSTDFTADILENYGSKIHVITQCNRGLSVARNAGVRESTGKYLGLSRFGRPMAAWKTGDYGLESRAAPSGKPGFQ